MEKSKRKCNSEDILEMFDLFSNWLDNSDITVCGCSHIENPPRSRFYTNNSSISSAFWINGNHFKNILSSLDLCSVRIAQDVCFLLSLLVRGYGNRVSQEFIFRNISNSKKTMKSTQWDSQTFENAHKDHKIIEKMFPDLFKILYDADGKRIDGGYRDMGKIKISWGKAYKKNISNFDNLV